MLVPKFESPPRPLKYIISDKDLFSELNLPHEVNDIDNIYQYYKHRVAPQPLNSIQELNLDQSKSIIKGIVPVQSTSLEISLPYDWDSNPLNDYQATLDLNRHGFIVNLILAYQKTGNSAFIIKAQEYLVDWLNGSREVSFLRGNSMWVRGLEILWMPKSFWLSAATRIRNSWMPIMWGILQAPEGSPRVWVEMLKMISNQCEYILAKMTDGDDMYATASAALIIAGTMFPEFKRAPIWIDSGFAGIRQVIKGQFATDGAHFDLTSHYAMVTVLSLLEPLLLMKHNGVKVPSDIINGLRSPMEYLLAISNPLGELPSTKISDRTDIRRVFSRFGEFYEDIQGLKFVGSGGASGEPPPKLNYLMPDAGQVVLRTGWGRDDIYLFAEGGALGKIPHEDKLTFELIAFGKHLIQDPGRHSYNTGPIEQLLWSSKVHSVTSINSALQHRKICPPASWRPKMNKELKLIEGNNGHNIGTQMVFAGPWSDGLNRVHIRDFNLIDNRIIIIRDSILLPFNNPNTQVASRLQFGEGSIEYLDEHNLRFQAKDSQTFLHVFRQPYDGKQEERTTFLNDLQNGGIIAPNYMKLVPAPAVEFKQMIDENVKKITAWFILVPSKELGVNLSIDNLSSDQVCVFVDGAKKCAEFGEAKWPSKINCEYEMN